MVKTIKRCSVACLLWNYKTR